MYICMCVRTAAFVNCIFVWWMPNENWVAFQHHMNVWCTHAWLPYLLNTKVKKKFFLKLNHLHLLKEVLTFEIHQNQNKAPVRNNISSKIANRVTTSRFLCSIRQFVNLLIFGDQIFLSGYQSHFYLKLNSVNFQNHWVRIFFGLHTYSKSINEVFF